MEALGRSAKVRGGIGYQKEVAGSPVAVGIKKNCDGFYEIPASDSFGLGRFE
jgi:hypothetical protein